MKQRCNVCGDEAMYMEDGLPFCQRCHMEHLAWKMNRDSPNRDPIFDGVHFARVEALKRHWMHGGNMSSPRTHISMSNSGSRPSDTPFSRPYVIINVAMSADGKLSTRERRQVKISGVDDFSRVDELKAGCDAIMVGIGTVLADDPSLTIKSDALIRMRREQNRPSHPVRIVVDSMAKIPPDAKILHKGEGKRIIALSCAADFNRVERLKQIAAQYGEDIEAELIVCGKEQVDLLELCKELKMRGIHRLMVEGGGTLIMSLFKAGIVDEVHTYIGNMIIGGKDAPTLADGEGFVLEDEFAQLTLHSLSQMEDGVLLSWYVNA